MKRLFLSIIFLTIVGFLAYYNLPKQTRNAEASWYSSTGWNYRKQLIIDATKVSGTTNLTNFPVLVSRTDNDLKANAQSDGDDILFTSSDGITKLDHEIETYTTATGELVAWVEIPTLDYDDDTAIYMYYGNSSATSQQNVSGTWASIYDAVFHLNQSPSGATGEILDSTSNNLDGTSLGSMSSANSLSGKLGSGINFDGTDDRIQMDTTYNPANTGAVILWMKPDSVNDGNLRRVLGGADAYEIVQDNDTPHIMNQLFNSSWLESTLDLSTSWNHIVSTYNFDTNISKIYINSIDDGTGTSSTDPGTITLSLGFRTGAASAYYGGMLDEIRIMNIVPSSDWISTEYANQNDPISFFKQVSAAQSETQANTTPDLSYNMDEGYGTTLNSTGTNNHTSTITGAIWRTEDLCVSDKCLYLDGTDDVVTTAGTTTNVKTVSFWVRPMTTTEQLVDLNGTASISISSGTISATSFTAPTIYVDGQVSSTLTANRWQHVTVTTATGISASAIKLGQISTNYGQMFMDEFQLYSTQLSQDQVKSLYNARGGNPTSVQFGAYDQKSLSDGLVGYWKMDESSWNGTAGEVLDSSGNANNGQGNDNATTTSGKFANAGSFDGTTDNLEVSHNNSLDPSGSWTIASWFNTNDITGSDSQLIIVKGERENEANLRYYAKIGAFTGSFNFGFANSWTDYEISYDLDDNGFTANQWIHFVGTYDSNTNSLTLYLNGKEVISPTVIGASPPSNTNPLRIGSGAFGTVEEFNGEIDEARVFNRTLTSVEVSQLYNWAPGPVGYWKMDENVGTTSYDTSTYTNNMSLNGVPIWSTGKFGSSLKFDGSDDYLVTPHSNSLNVGQGDITISAWIKPNSDPGGGYKTIITKGQGNGGRQFNLRVGCGSGDSICAEFGQTSNASFTQALSIGQWQLLTVVRSGTTATLHYNGVLVSTATGVNGTDTNGSDIEIGGTSGGGTFDGAIDNVQIYNYARTPSQIIQDMNAGHPLVGTPVAGPVAHWSFDEGYGTTANDQTPNNKDLTLNTASWTNDGKFNKAWNGTGANWISRTSDNIFDRSPGDDLSISLWMRSDATANPGATEYILNKNQISITDEGYKIYVNTNGTITAGIDDDGASFPEDSVSTSTDLYDSTWHHLVFIKTGSSKLELYVDGKLISTDSSISATGSQAAGDTLVLGDLTGANDGDEFNGNLDEIKIYHSALTTTDVLAEYNQGKSLVLGSISTESNGTTPSNSASREYCIPGDSTSCPPPVVEYKFDESAGTSANDTSGNGNNGALDGTAPGPQWVPGRTGGALNFQDGQYVFKNSASNLPANSITMQAWLNHSTAWPNDSGYDTILMFNGDGGGWLQIQNNELVCGIDAASAGSYDEIFTSGWNPQINKWYHVVCTYNVSNDEVKIYSNGTLLTTEISSKVFGDPSSITVSGGGESFNGQIDQIRIYDYVRNPAQIAWDYNKGAPIAHWQFDETSGVTAYDNSGNSLTGTLINTPTRTTSGKFNSAIDFDGADDHVTIPDNNIFSPPVGGFTVATWFNADTLDAGVRNYIVTKGTTSNYEWALGSYGSTDAYCETWDLNGDNHLGIGGSEGYTTGIPITTGEWHHLACVVIPNTRLEIYLDGKLRFTDTSATGFALGNGTSTVDIGRRADDADSEFDGRIDDVRIYNYPLTTEQVKLIVNDNSAIRFAD